VILRGSGSLSFIANACFLQVHKLPKTAFFIIQIGEVKNPRYLNQKTTLLEVEDDHASKRGSSAPALTLWLHAWPFPCFSFAGQPAWALVREFEFSLNSVCAPYHHIMRHEIWTTWFNFQFNPTHHNMQHTMEPQLLTTQDQYPFIFSIFILFLLQNYLKIVLKSKKIHKKYFRLLKIYIIFWNKNILFFFKISIFFIIN